MKITYPVRAGALILSALLLFSATGCGKSEPLPSFSVSPEDAKGIELATVSIEEFKAAAAAYGEIQDLSQQVGYGCASVVSDNYNILYLDLPDVISAKSMALSDQDLPDAKVSISSSGENYDFFEETSQGDASQGVNPFYGYYVRVDAMLILFTGSLDKKDDVKEQAKAFYHSLGYTLA